MKGTNIITFTGEAEWCKYLEKSINRGTYAPKGEYSTNLLADPNDAEFKAFQDKINLMLDALKAEILDDKCGDVALSKAHKDTLVRLEPWKDHVPNVKNAAGEWVEGTPTGKIMISPKLKNVDDKEKGRDYVKLIGVGNKEVPRSQCPEIGNGSLIKCKVYVNPYFMAGQKQGGIEIPPRYGVSLSLGAIKIINLIEFDAGSGEDFDEDEGFTPEGNDNGFDDSDSNGSDF